MKPLIGTKIIPSSLKENEGQNCDLSRNSIKDKRIKKIRSFIVDHR